MSNETDKNIQASYELLARVWDESIPRSPAGQVEQPELNTTTPAKTRKGRTALELLQKIRTPHLYAID